MIELKNITIRVGQLLLENLSFRVERGQYAVVMGKTGIGKTTILESICGLRSVQSGSILINQVDVTNWSPADRHVGYSPQDLALFPTMTVRQHLEFALKVRRRPASEIAARVESQCQRPERRRSAASRPGTSTLVWTFCAFA